MAQRTKRETFIDNPPQERTVPLIGSPNEAESYFKSPYWNLSYHFPDNPDPLAQGNNYGVYDEMNDDDQVKSALSIKKDMVVNSGWVIQGESEEVNEFITDVLENINVNTGLDNSFDDVLRDMLSAYSYGFSLSEPVHTMESGKVVYKALLTRPPHSFRFHVDDKGMIEKIEQITNKGSLYFKPQQFVHHIYQMEFGNPYGKSDLRSAYNSWKAKKFFTRMFAVYVEKYASPPLVGKFPSTYSTAEMQQFLDTLKTMQNATTFAVPDDVMIEFVQSSRDASDVYLKGLDYYNMQIARSILVPDLLGLGGTETKGGSFALGKEQFKVFLSTIKKDRESLERKITMKMVRPLVLANFGEIDCWFQFKPWTFDDVKEYLDLWLKAVTGDVYVPNDEEIQYFRQATGFPEGEIIRPKEPEKVMVYGGMVGRNEGNGGDTEDKPKTGEEQPKDIEDEAGIEEEDVEEKVFARRSFQRLDRESEKEVQGVERFLDGSTNRAIRDVSVIQKKIYEDYIDQIISKGLITKFKPESINTLQPRYLRELKVALSTYYSTLYKESYTQAQEELLPEQKKKFAVEPLLPKEFLTVLEQETFKEVGDYSSGLSVTGKQIVFDSVKGGWGVSETIRLVRDQLKNKSGRWAETVIRTKTNEIYNSARLSYFLNDPIAKQMIGGFQWSSVLDSRTSDYCNEMHGQYISVDQIDTVRPPAHLNCRSRVLPVSKLEKAPFVPAEELPSPIKEDGKLKNGAGIVVQREGIIPKRTPKQKKVFQLEDKPALINSNVINLFGDTVVIGSAGMGRKINIISIYASNTDLEQPVIVGFKGQNESELRFKTLLAKSGGLLSKEFYEPLWILDENEAFVINLSAQINVEYTCEYIITNLEGIRVM